MAQNSDTVAANALLEMDVDERGYLVDLLESLSAVAGGREGFTSRFDGLEPIQKRLVRALAGEHAGALDEPIRHWMLYHWPVVRQTVNMLKGME
jgi:hypothetical protein